MAYFSSRVTMQNDNYAGDDEGELIEDDDLDKDADSMEEEPEEEEEEV